MAAKDTKKMMNLKIMVDTKANKVVFAEASKEFVDFISQLLSLPLSTVVKLVNDNRYVVGCLGDQLFKTCDNNNSNKAILQENNGEEGGLACYTYMVMDDLEVKPMSFSLVKSHVKQFDYLVEKQVEVGFQEGLAMVKALLQTKNGVLTAVFLGKKEGLLSRLTRSPRNRLLRYCIMLLVCLSVVAVIAEQKNNGSTKW